MLSYVEPRKMFTLDVETNEIEHCFMLVYQPDHSSLQVSLMSTILVSTATYKGLYLSDGLHVQLLHMSSISDWPCPLPFLPIGGRPP